METRTTLFWGRELTFERREGRPLAVALRNGDRAVALVERTHPDQEGTHDTGLVEELYLEFKSQPAIGETLDARQALAKAFYQFGGVALVYQSNTFEGTIRLTAWEWGARMAGSCSLEFTFPILDLVDSDAVRIQADFDGMTEQQAAASHPQRWICRACGAINIGEQGACLRCRTPLTPTGHAAETGQPGEAAEACPACGAHLEAGNRFCTRCGARLR